MQSLGLKCKGLITNPNTLEPGYVDGALAVADNIVIDKDNIAESRRGFSKYNQYVSLGSYTNTISDIFSYDDEIFIHYNNKIAIDPGDGSSWDEFSGTYSDPDTGFDLSPLEQNQNLYITTSAGIKKLDATDGDFGQSGIVRSLDGFGSVTGSTGWFNDDTAVAYRMLWGKYDANNNLILGSPSARLVMANSAGGSRNTELTWLIPSEITTDYFYQIYRSGLTESASDEPNDEMQLVIEGKPASGEITAGEFVVMDDVVDTLKGATLYTSPSQEGIANANEPPPFAKDMASFKNHVFYANTKTKHRLSLTLIGVSGTSFDVGDTFVVDSVTYTGAAAEDSNNDEFLVYGADTPAINIQETALSLVKIINKSSNNTGIYAYYLSGFEDVPGQILFERRSLDGASFTATSSAGDSFSPEIPSSGTNDDNTSDNEVKINRIYISKQQQPEAVPLFSYLDIGSANKAIKKIIALRDSVFVFKEDGVYKITGENIANFRVTLFDSNIDLIAPNSAVTFNNTIFCMTLQGVVSISDSGVAVVSRPIENLLLPLIQYSNFETTTFGVSYESERKYILFCVNGENQSYPTQAFVYNSFTNAWTRWTLDPLPTCGFVNKADDKLYYGGKLEGYQESWVHKERKTFSSDDYVDDDWGVLIQTVNSTTELELNRTDDCVVGYWIRQYMSTEGTYNLAKITAIDTDTRTVTLSPAQSNWSNDPINPVTIYKPITCRAKWVANTAGNPGMIKHFREASLFFRQDSTANLKIGYETNFQPGYTYTEKSLEYTGTWGDYSWGTVPWNGVDDTYNQPIRVGIPRQKQRCLWISFSVEGANAFSSFSLAGISAHFETVSERWQWNSADG